MPYIEHNDVLNNADGNAVIVDGNTLVENQNVARSEFQFVTSANTDGNYGGFVCNPYFEERTIGADLFGAGYSSYMDIISRYNKIHNILVDGLKLKKIIIHNEKFYVANFTKKVGQISLYEYDLIDGSYLNEQNNEKYEVDDSKIISPKRKKKNF